MRGYFLFTQGVEAGSAGCIDLWKNNNEFVIILLKYVEQYQDEILKNWGKIPLVVKYEDDTTMECDSNFYTKYYKPIDL